MEEKSKEIEDKLYKNVKKAIELFGNEKDKKILKKIEKEEEER